MTIEWTQDSGRGGFVGRVGRELVGYLIDERFEAKDVAEKLTFVALLIGHLAGCIYLYAVSRSNYAATFLWARCTSSTPSIHSSTLSSFSRAKSWRCCIKLVVSCLTRGVAFGPVALMTACVKFGLTLCSLLFCTTVPLVVILYQRFAIEKKLSRVECSRLM